MATALDRRWAADAARARLEDRLAVQNRSLLRFITCGSVDDGKSTLIGRLLYDSNLLFDDQLDALATDSRKSGTQGDALDFALLVDGLSAEREQGITIDVAYRFFSTDKRKFIVADTPGHEHYTRNMVTGASTAELAVILIDARKGVLPQTRRHSYLVHLLGIRRLVLAVNKMDLVGNDRAVFERIVEDYRDFAREAGIGGFAAIPVCAVAGGNVSRRSDSMPWYEGPTLLEHLESVPLAGGGEGEGLFRMVVQWVNRPHHDFRGYAGQVASGSVRAGDEIAIVPAGRRAKVARIVTFDGDLDRAVAGQSVTLTFAEELDCSRGDLLVSPDGAPDLVARIEATLIWMSEEAMVPHRSYWMKIGAQTVSANVTGMGPTLDIGTMGQREGIGLGLNDIGRAEIDLDRRIPAVRYADNRQLGGFILIDKVTHATVAAGLVEGFLGGEAGRADHPEEETGDIVWVSGPSPAARAAWAQKDLERLKALGRPASLLDETVIRGGLNSDLDEGGAAHAEHIRRLREVALLMSKAGVHVLVTVEVPESEAHPGRRVEATSAEDEGADDWVI